MTSRTEIINHIFDKYNFESYLEIGVYYPQNNFDKINAKLKHSVDNLQGAEGWYTHYMDSDTFFNYWAGNQKYDVIFIDAFHEEHQCYKDVKNALNHLNVGGFIVMHDCMPLSKDHIISVEEFLDGPGGRWNGTVFKAFIRLKRELADWSCFVVDEEDGGCGILTNRKILANIPMPLEPQHYFAWEEYEKNRENLLQLISFEQFKKL